MYVCMETFYKVVNITDKHLLDKQLLQDKNWMKSEQFH